jgi:hypothetical protein
MWLRRLRQIVIVAVLLLLIGRVEKALLLAAERLFGLFADTESSSRHPGPGLWDNLSLTEAQCAAAFPGLTKEVDEAVSRGTFSLKRTGSRGPLKGRIRDGKVREPLFTVRGDGRYQLC